MNLPVFVNVVVFALTIAFLVRRRRNGGSVSSNVLLAVVLLETRLARIARIASSS